VLAAFVEARELAHEIVETAAGRGKLAQREPGKTARRGCPQQQSEVREIAALDENLEKICHEIAPPQRVVVPFKTCSNRQKRAPAATAAGATGRRQWFAGLAATQQF
jgi:hypothetical protein